jgi:hypothetical protein
LTLNTPYFNDGIRAKRFSAVVAIYPDLEGDAHCLSLALVMPPNKCDSARAGDWVFSMLDGRDTRPPSDLLRWAYVSFVRANDDS